MKKLLSLLIVGVLILLSIQIFNLEINAAKIENEQVANIASDNNDISITSDNITNITVEEAWELISDPSNSIQIPIDVRTPKEFINERIYTPEKKEKPRLFPVQLMEYEGLLLRFFMLLYKDRDVISYCKAGVRSWTAAQILVDQGFTGKIYNMIGGIDAWKEAGLPTVEGLFP